jgi:hypothetical protein
MATPARVLRQAAMAIRRPLTLLINADGPVFWSFPASGKVFGQFGKLARQVTATDATRL